MHPGWLRTITDTHLFGNFYISLSQVALLFGSICDGVLHLDNAVASGLKHRTQAVNNLHSAGFVDAALTDVYRLCDDPTKVFVTPAARIGQTFVEQEWGHLYLLSNWRRQTQGVYTKPWDQYHLLWCICPTNNYLQNHLWGVFQTELQKNKEKKHSW